MSCGATGNRVTRRHSLILLAQALWVMACTAGAGAGEKGAENMLRGNQRGHWAFFRNRPCHPEAHTMDTLDFHCMAEVVKGLFRALQKMEELG